MYSFSDRPATKISLFSRGFRIFRLFGGVGVGIPGRWDSYTAQGSAKDPLLSKHWNSHMSQEFHRWEKFRRDKQKRSEAARVLARELGERW